jgi:Mg-chelatase subunit ChlD
VVFSARRNDSSANELTPSDLEIKEDGKPVSVVAISKLGRVPLHYCLVFDISGSEATNFKVQQRGATELLARVIEPGVNRDWLLAFNDQGRESAETNDPRQIAGFIPQLVPHGETSLYDAMATCANQMAKGTAGARELGAMFLFTDGEDDVSRLNHEQAAEAVVKAGLRIYAFCLVTLVAVRDICSQCLRN